jgi:hypothetical protein
MSRGLKTGALLGLVGLLVIGGLLAFFGGISNEPLNTKFQGDLDPSMPFVIETGDIDLTIRFADVDHVRTSLRTSAGWPFGSSGYGEDGNRVFLSGSCPRWVPRCDVESTVTVPAGMSVTVTSTSGDVEVENGPFQALEITTVSGDVEVEAAPEGTYRIDVTSESGEIDAPASDPASTSTIRVRTNSGDIDIDTDR